MTAVCSARNLEMVRTIDADQVIDDTQEDFTQSGRHYDLILAAKGNHSVFAYKRAMSPKARSVLSGGEMAQLYQVFIFGPLLSMTGGRKLGSFVAQPNQKDLIYLAELAQSGKIKAVIDRRYLLPEFCI